jgi:hypothetical protein
MMVQPRVLAPAVTILAVKILAVAILAVAGAPPAPAQEFKPQFKPLAPAESPDALHRRALRPLADLSYLRCHQVLAARSEDGLVFRPDPQPLIDEASAPEAVVDDKGLRLYYVNGAPGKHGIWTVRAEEQGGGWRMAAPEPVQIDGAFNGDAVQPDVVRLPDGKLRLYYFLGFFVTRQPKQIPGMVERPNRLMTALSEDGVHFTGEGRAIQLDAAEHPSVIRLANGRFLMASTQTKTQRILLLTSSEGSRFILNGAVVHGGAAELAALDDGTIRLYHESPDGIASQISHNGGNRWDAEPGLRLQLKTPAAEPSVARLASGGWRMFFRSVKPGCAAP